MLASLFHIDFSQYVEPKISQKRFAVLEMEPQINVHLLKMSLYMAYSIHSHISYILETNSKRPNGFSLIGRKPN